MAKAVTTLGSRNITGYSVQEDATPLDASSTEGGVGTINFALPEGDDSLDMYDTTVELNDDFRGVTSGTVTSVSLTGGINSVTVNNRLGVLTGTTQAAPMVGTFESVARYYLGLAGITDGIYFDPRLAAITMTVQGWNDDAWLKLKQLCMAYNVEVSLVSNNIVFRPVRSFTTDIMSRTDLTVEVAATDAAQAIEVNYYGNNWVDGEVIYPRNVDELAAAQVYTVEAGAVLEDDIELTVSLASVQQPICVDDVAKDYDGTQSVYSVRGSDNSLITAQNWAALGGKIELTINPDTTSVHIKITASSDEYYGPYRICGRMKDVVDATTVIIGPGQSGNPATDPTVNSPDTGSTSSSKTKVYETYPAAADDYPWPKAAVHTLSPLRYDYRECVDFVAWRINRDAGVKHAPWKWTWANLRKTNGNAIGWKHDWELHGWKTNIKPVPGCIAWFGSSAGSLGHVAYVQKVTDQEVLLEDYNWGGTHTYHKHYMKKTSIDSFLASPAPSTKKTTTTKPSTTEAVNPGYSKDGASVPGPEVNGDENMSDYASLRIVGTGTVIEKETLTLPTGMPESRTVAPVGTTVENIFVSDPETAYRVGAYTATRFKGEEQTINGTLTKINYRSGTGTMMGPTIADFDGTYKAQTIANFNATWAGKTFGDFRKAQEVQVKDTFDNQVFGNVAGARFRHKDAYYRITSATISNSSIEFSATRDTMIAEFNNAHAGKTIADFNAQYAGMTFKQFGRKPLQGG